MLCHEQALVGALSPLFEERCYANGGSLAREGEAADALFYVEEGTVQICFSRKQRPDEDLVDSEVGLCRDIGFFNPFCSYCLAL